MGTGIYLALGVVAVHGRGLTPVAMLVAGLVVLTAAGAYAEGISLFPEAGGSAALARHAFDELTSFLTGWATALALIATAALSAYFAARYLSVFWDPLASGGWSVAGAVVVLAVVSCAAARGLVASPGMAILAGIVDIGVQLLLVVMGVAFAFRPETIGQSVHFGTSPSLAGLLVACALAMAAYTGIESIGEMAAEARHPDRDLAPATAGVLVSAVSLCAAIALASVMAAPASGRVSSARPVLGIVSQIPLHVLASGLGYIVGLFVAGLLALAAHASVRRFGRLAVWQAQHHQIPARIADAHPTLETPTTAVAACAVAATLLVMAQPALGGASFMAGAYAFGALIAFTGVHASIVSLRWRDQGRYRPVEAPLNLTVGGRRIPLTALMGGASAATLWLALVALQGDVRYLGAAWMVLGTAGYAANRRRLGLSLTERTPAEVAARRGPGVEVEFRTLLIPVNTAAASSPADLVDVAAQLAAERRASLVVLAFTEIPLGEEIDMEIDDLDGVVERLAAAGRAIGTKYGIHVHTSHLRTRDPAESILAEATRRDSQVIVLRAGGLQRIDLRRVTYDHVVRRIVAEARQRVMIVRPEVET